MPTRSRSTSRRRRAAADADAKAATTARREAPEAWVQFIGNATLLIRYGPFTILTDPNLVHRGAEVTLGYGLTATRTTDPALDAEQVPRPDLVIVSHDHGDHFDEVAADWLPAGVPILTAPGAAASLEQRGFRDVRALATWSSAEFVREGVRLRVTAVPARHGPGPIAAMISEVMGSVLELWADAPAAGGGDDEHAPDLRMYLSGDTVFHDGLAELRDRFGEVDVAFLHLGGMRLMGMQVTMDADQGIRLINLLQPRLAIPVHYNDYGTSTSPLAEFVAAVNEAGLTDRVRYLRHGDTWPLVGSGSEPGEPGREAAAQAVAADQSAAAVAR